MINAKSKQNIKNDILITKLRAGLSEKTIRGLAQYAKTI